MELRFRVRCPKVASWESLFVVGNCDPLGRWQSARALELFQTEQSIWEGRIEILDSTKELLFRYFIGYKLDATTTTSEKQTIVARWEAALNPRKCLPSLEISKNGIIRENCTDDFGKYDGKELVSDGWIQHQNENVILLRIHGEALKFYKQRYKTKQTRLKIVPFDVRFKERDTVEEDVPEEERDPVLPDVPSFSNTELSVLTREDPIFGEQYANGSLFRNHIDYLVFRTKTVSVENLAFRIELYHEKQRVAMCYALPAALPDTYGKSTFPIICNQHMPIVDYMLVKPLNIERELNNSMAVTFGKYWRKRKTLEVGHRGMGNSYTKIACERENTIQSLKQAAKKGADLVEFDVQLTKDLQPIIYHDFHLLIEVTGRNGAIHEDHQHHEIAIKDLKLGQLNLLHFEHIHVKKAKPSTSDSDRVIPSREEVQKCLEKPDFNDDDYNPFPALENALKNLNEHVGFNIEIKYPMPLKDGSHECAGYFERNQFVDTILRCVFSNCGSRRIVFSCFDPDICTLVAQKQHRFPVLFLVVGATTRYVPFQDIRSDSSKMAVHYAAASNLLGVNFHSEELLANKDPVKLAEKYGLVTFVWGDDLNLKEHQEFFRVELKVDGVIYDRIGEFEQRQNVFLVEKEAREALFVKSPAPSRMGSRRNSMDKSSFLCDVSPPRDAPSLRRSNSQDGRSHGSS